MPTTPTSSFLPSRAIMRPNLSCVVLTIKLARYNHLGRWRTGFGNVGSSTILSFFASSSRCPPHLPPASFLPERSWDLIYQASSRPSNLLAMTIQVSGGGSSVRHWPAVWQNLLSGLRWCHIRGVDCQGWIPDEPKEVTGRKDGWEDCLINKLRCLSLYSLHTCGTLHVYLLVACEVYRHK